MNEFKCLDLDFFRVVGLRHCFSLDKIRGILKLLRKHAKRDLNLSFSLRSYL